MINAQQIFDDKWAEEAAASSLNMIDFDMDNMDNNTSLEAGFFNTKVIDINNDEEFEGHNNFNSFMGEDEGEDEDTSNKELKSAGV